MADAHSMRALVFEGPDQLSLRQVARPEPQAGEVLVRVHATTICGSDVRIVAGRKTRDVRRGHPIGHECAGTVAAVGSGVTQVSVGDRVGVCVVVSCGTCPYCRADQENICGDRFTLGYHTDGCFAEFMLIPAPAVRRGNLFKLPASVSFEGGALLEPMACCLNGQHEFGLAERDDRFGPSESLVSFGAGPIGLLHLLIAKGKRPDDLAVTLVEPQPDRRAVAEDFGADAVYSPDDFEPTGRSDAALLAVAVPDLVGLAMRAVRRGGKVSLFAGFDAGATALIDPNAIHYQQLRITGASESRRRDYAEALSLVADGTVSVERLITDRFGLDDHEEAFRRARSGESLKIALIPAFFGPSGKNGA